MLVSQPLPRLSEQPIGRRERRAVNLHGFAARQDGSTAAIKLVDLSYNGCGIETTAQLKLGERIELSVLRRGAIIAHVRWCADGHAGLAFEAVPAAQKRLSRNSERIPMLAEVDLRRSGKPTYRVRLTDASPVGCRVETVDRPHVDELVWVKFEGLEALEATVCWVAGHKTGLKYTKPIHPAVFDLMLTKFRGKDG